VEAGEYRKLRVLVVQRVKRKLPQSKRGAGADARAADDAARGGLPPVREGWAQGVSKSDLYHFLSLCIGLAETKTSPLFPAFAVTVAMAALKPMAGEYAAAVKHLEHRVPRLRDESNRWKLSRVPWKYFRRRMRYVCPDPLTIMSGLQCCMTFWSNCTCPASQGNFLAPMWRKDLHALQLVVASGVLSDKPGMSMYLKIGEYKGSRLCRWRCLRGDNALEGYHVHLRRLVEHMYTTASEAWLDCVMNLFDHRWSVQAARTAGLFDPHCR
jgi:hypothetical protein